MSSARSAAAVGTAALLEPVARRAADFEAALRERSAGTPAQCPLNAATAHGIRNMWQVHGGRVHAAWPCAEAHSRTARPAW